jgi:hypothetical protein
MHAWFQPALHTSLWEKFETEYYLPAGTWTAITPLCDMEKPRVIVGPRWVKEAVHRPDSRIRTARHVLILAPSGIKNPGFNLFDRVEVGSPQTTCDALSRHGSEFVTALQVTQGDTLNTCNYNILNTTFMELWFDRIRLDLQEHGHNT